MRFFVQILTAILCFTAPSLLGQFTMGGLGASMGMMGGLQGMGSTAMGTGMGAVGGLGNTMGMTGGMMGGMTPGLGGMGGMGGMGM